MRYRETITGAFDVPFVRQQYERSLPTDSFTPTYRLEGFTGTRTVKSISDVETPSFYRLRQCGSFLPLNPVTITKRVETRVPGPLTYVRRRNNYPDGSVGAYWIQTKQDPGVQWNQFPSSVFDVPAYDEAIISSVVNSSIADAKASTWDALTTAAEANKTAQMVGKRMRNLFNYAGWVAGKSRGKTLDLRLESFSRLWLEYRYGWRPMVFDIEDMIAAFTRKVEQGELVRGRARQTTSLSDEDIQTSVDEGRSTLTITTTREGSRVYRGKAYCRVTDASRATFGTDVILTGYELVPFSFIFDWAFDVNSYLQAVSPFSGAASLGSMASIRDKYTIRQDVNLVWGPGLSSVPEKMEGDYNCSTIIEVDQYTRFPQGATLPGFNLRLTPARVLDLAALIISSRAKVLKRITAGLRI